jgi:hypothetical protein
LPEFLAQEIDHDPHLAGKAGSAWVKRPCRGFEIGCRHFIVRKKIDKRAFGQLALIHAKSDAPLFPIDLVEKDFAYALDQPGAVLPMTKAGHECFAKAKAKGLTALNITAVARLYQIDG